MLNMIVAATAYVSPTNTHPGLHITREGRQKDK